MTHSSFGRIAATGTAAAVLTLALALAPALAQTFIMKTGFATINDAQHKSATWMKQELAKTTGGRYFRATDPEALHSIFQLIDQLERTPVTVTRYTQFDEAFRLPLLVGLGALVMELLISATVVTRRP